MRFYRIGKDRQVAGPEDQDGVEPFDEEEPSAPIRELTEEGRTFQVKAILGHLDSPHCDYSKTRFCIDNPVRVYNDAAEVVGHAMVDVVGGKLVADASLDYSSPERLIIETKSERLFAYLLADVHFQQHESQSLRVWDLHGGPRAVQEVQVHGVGIVRRRPNDPRLLPLGEPVLT